MAHQHGVAEHLWRQRMEQRFLLRTERVRNVHEVPMRVDISPADAGIVLEAKPDARLARKLADQNRVGFDLADIGGVRSLDAADIWIVRIVVDVDDRREIVADAERAQLMEAGGENLSLLFPRQKIEILRARQR